MQRFKLLARPFYISFILFVFIISCKPKKFIYKSPPHYNFSTLLTNKLDLKLQEISGVVWDSQRDQFIAHNDEKGIIYYLDKGNGDLLKEFSFGEKGDYEDIALVKSDVYVLRSDGMLFKIETDSTGKQKSFDLGEIELPGKKDFESLYYDPERKALIMLCKSCEMDNKKMVSAFAYYPDSIGFDNKPLYSIDLAAIEKLSPRETSKFQPSAARIHPILKKLFILSSASHQLVIADTDGTPGAVYMLAKKLFPQAEGITFKNNGDMYIANEGVGAKGTLLKCVYTP